ncbi:MAG TPA: lysophospholipid acyltransferase family protein [Gaiellaceae bacterium]|nr:lysophospholipid acyltransferase family protein [Gaiellaceae bacterium]
MRIVSARQIPVLYRIATWIFPPFFAGRKRWIGVENVPESGFVLASNHVSSMDPFVLGMPLWPARRPVRYMAKAELFNRWLGWAMRAIGTFPVRRGEADADAMRTALQLLRDGEIVGMFPEGTRASKGLRKKFEAKPHPGTARIALAAGVPLVPAAVVGTAKLLRFSPVTVAFGPPIPLDDLAGMPRRRAAEIATERLMTAIDGLVTQIDR